MRIRTDAADIPLSAVVSVPVDSLIMSIAKGKEGGSRFSYGICDEMEKPAAAAAAVIKCTMPTVVRWPTAHSIAPPPIK